MPTTLDHRTRTSLLRELAVRDPVNQEAWAAFSRRYEDLVRKWCRRARLQRADEDEVVQRIVLKLLKILPEFQYDPKKSFRGLLYTLVAHEIKDYFREKHRKPGGYGTGDTNVLDGLVNKPATPDDSSIDELVGKMVGQLERDQQVREVCETVRGRVEPHTWQAFWLTAVEDQPTAYVAQQLGMTNGAVLQAKFRVTKMIQRRAQARPTEGAQ